MVKIKLEVTPLLTESKDTMNQRHNKLTINTNSPALDNKNSILKLIITYDAMVDTIYSTCELTGVSPRLGFGALKLGYLTGVIPSAALANCCFL